MSAAPKMSCPACHNDGAALLFVKHGYRLVRCGMCDLAYIDNPPDAAGIAALYQSDDGYHDRLIDRNSGEYARMDGVARRHMQVLTRHCPSPKGAGRAARVLDVGCSAGLFLKRARDAGFAVSGLEMSPRSVEYARDTLGLNVQQGAIEDADFADGSFDIITLFDVIEHLSDPYTAAKQLAQWLKPGGILLMSTPNIDGLFPRVSYLPAKALDYWPHPEPPHHLFQFSEKTLAGLARQAGLQPARADHFCLPLGYSFGTLKNWRISKKLVPYAAIFAPLAAIGPKVRMGDWIYLASRKPSS
jgi:2-polyprenyl-3-methyl-5-hydroxy-6-metoxy-1,4-benzoquinol methylase